MTAAEIRAAVIIRRVNGIKRPLVAEIGVAGGRLSKALLRDHKTVHLTMVDNWAPEEGQGEGYKATGDSNARLTPERASLHEKLAREAADKHPARTTVIKGDSVDTARFMIPASFDLVFIDADHSYEGCRADIAAWLPMVKPGGWIGGHDYKNTEDVSYDFSGVDRAVSEMFGAILTDNQFTWWARV